jgi:DNA-binding NtrC family response regulator
MPSPVRILVIDDEDIVCQSCSRILTEEGHAVDVAHGGHEGLDLLEKAPCDILLLDLKMPGLGGMEVLQRVRERHPEIDVLMVTGYSTVETAVQAMKLGAFDYICKPFSPDELALVVRRIVEKRRLLAENLSLQQELWTKYRLDNIVGTSRRMEDLFRLIAKVAATQTTVLIQGESGVGKELVAKAIHYNSLRSAKPFVAVDCAGIPETLLEGELFGHAAGAYTGATGARKGLLEAAQGGTLFIDEVSNVPALIQPKLLRVLQEHEYRPLGDVRTVKMDVRIIAATNVDLEEQVKLGRFRGDLLYRLNVFPLRVPPLRERREDIPALTYHFMKKANAASGCQVKRVSAEAMAVLVAHDWPGNVRQLANVVESAVILAADAPLRPEHLPQAFRKPAPDPAPASSDELKEVKKNLRASSTQQIERAFLLDALERNDWSVTRAAADVGMQRSNFQAMMRHHGIRIRRSSTGGDEGV